MTANFIVRALLSGVIIACIAVIGRKAPAAGALIASLPLISIMGMLWLWHDTGDKRLLANHAEATFWYVLPSLPMFLLVPWIAHGLWVLDSIAERYHCYNVAISGHNLDCRALWRAAIIGL
jgi:hypothetical protein